MGRKPKDENAFKDATHVPKEYRNFNTFKQMGIHQWDLVFNHLETLATKLKFQKILVLPGNHDIGDGANPMALEEYETYMKKKQNRVFETRTEGYWEDNKGVMYLWFNSQPFSPTAEQTKEVEAQRTKNYKFLIDTMKIVKQKQKNKLVVFTHIAPFMSRNWKPNNGTFEGSGWANWNAIYREAVLSKFLDSGLKHIEWFCGHFHYPVESLSIKISNTNFHFHYLGSAGVVMKWGGIQKEKMKNKKAADWASKNGYQAYSEGIAEYENELYQVNENSGMQFIEVFDDPSHQCRSTWTTIKQITADLEEKT